MVAERLIRIFGHVAGASLALLSRQSKDDDANQNPAFPACGHPQVQVSWRYLLPPNRTAVPVDAS
jgi:hypothetical protein